VSERGDLLEFVCGASGRLPTLSATVRTWSHSARQHQARAEAAQAQGGYVWLRTGRSRPRAGSSHQGLVGLPAETEQVQRLLVVPGTRAFRIEAGGPPRRVTVSDGTVSWDEVAPGEFVRHPGQRLPWEMAALLDPSWLAGYDWGTPARGTHAGREVLSLHVTPRAGFAGPRVAGLLPSDLDVVIDAAFGFLHRLVGLYRDEPYQVVELLDLDLGPHGRRRGFPRRRVSSSGVQSRGVAPQAAAGTSQADLALSCLAVPPTSAPPLTNQNECLVKRAPRCRCRPHEPPSQPERRRSPLAGDHDEA
jgi:hypothetical protein